MKNIYEKQIEKKIEKAKNDGFMEGIGVCFIGIVFLMMIVFDFIR